MMKPPPPQKPNKQQPRQQPTPKAARPLRPKQLRPRPPLLQKLRPRSNRLKSDAVDLRPRKSGRTLCPDPAQCRVLGLGPVGQCLGPGKLENRTPRAGNQGFSPGEPFFVA